MTTEDETHIRQKSLEVVNGYFEAMHRIDIDAWSDLWNEDAVVNIPIPSKGFVSVYQGLTDQIRPGMIEYFSLLETYDYNIDAIHPSIDPEIVIVEWDLRATVKQSDKVYEGKSITVFKMKNGKIAEYQDYFNAAYFEILKDMVE